MNRSIETKIMRINSFNSTSRYPITIMLILKGQSPLHLPPTLDCLDLDIITQTIIIKREYECTNKYTVRFSCVVLTLTTLCY